MQQFFTFVIHHWELWLAFIVVLVFLIIFEIHNKLTGLPQLTPQQATMLINREDAVVLDLRDSASFAKGHVINALNVPLADIANKTQLLQKYKEKTLILALNPGQPLSKAYKHLQNQGFSKLYQLKGGMQAWQGAGLPLSKK